MTRKAIFRKWSKREAQRQRGEREIWRERYGERGDRSIDDV